MSSRRLLFAVVTLLVASMAFAQGFQLGTLAGTVVDDTGGALPGVTITLVDQDRGVSRTEVTDERGRFRFPQLLVGNYTVEASLAGFQSVSVTGNRVTAERTTDVSVTLRLATETAVITVTGEAPIVDKTDASVNTNIGREQFEQAPVGRGYQDLVNFAPGVVDVNDDDGNPNVNGASDDANVFLFDGVDTTDTTTGTFGSNLNFEAIEEVNVYTSGVSAEYGRATGAVVNVITKSGSNDPEGSLKVLATNDKWNEQNDTVNEVTGASLARNKTDKTNYRYSGTLGGPIWRDRIWFFGAYETAEVTGALQTTAVTGEDYRSLREDVLQNYRLTAQLTPSHNIWGKWSEDPITGFVNDYWGASADTYALTSQDQGGDNWTVQYSGVFGSNITAEAMYATATSFINVVPFRMSSLTGGAPHLSLSDEYYYNGATFDGGVNRPRDQAVLALSYFANMGANTHDIKFGVDWQDLASENSFKFPNGQLFVDEDFNPSNQTYMPFLRYDFQTEPSDSSGEIVSAYVRDKFTVGERLFFEVGARFEQQTGKNDQGTKVLDTAVVAPRLAMNFDVAGNGRSVVNATVGRFYQSIIQDFADNFAAVPQQTNYDLYLWVGPHGYIGNAGNDANWELIDEFRADAGSSAPNLGLDPTYLDEITLGFQQQIGQTMGVGVRGIFRTWNDLIDDVLSFDANGDISKTFVNYDRAEREYRGVQFSLEKRFSNNWSGVANYTYSETEGNHFGSIQSNMGNFDDSDCFVADTGVGNQGVIPCSNVTSNARRYGNPTFDVPHILNVLGTYSRDLGPVNLAFGASGIYASGITYSKSRTAFVLGPDGEDSGQTLTYFYEGQGSDRLDNFYNLNTSLEATFDLFAGIEMGIKGEIFNVTDTQEKIFVDRTAWCENNTAACATTRDEFGAATRRASFQVPRAYRITALIRF